MDTTQLMTSLWTRTKPNRPLQNIATSIFSASHKQAGRDTAFVKQGSKIIVIEPHTLSAVRVSFVCKLNISNSCQIGCLTHTQLTACKIQEKSLFLFQKKNFKLKI